MGTLMSQLKKETEMCSKFTVSANQGCQGLQGCHRQVHHSEALGHVAPRQGVHFQDPVTECGPSCKPHKSQMTLKPVPFTCLPLGRMAENYLEKVIKGEA